MTVLLIAEHDCRTIKQATYHAITAAAQFNQAVDLLIIGKDCHTVATTGSTLPGISKVLVADHACYEHQLPENCAVLIANLAKNYEVVLAAATTFGKNLLPRAAALLDKAMLSDVIKIISPDTFVRPIYAGNVLQTVQLLESIKILTIRATAFQAVTPGASPVATMSTIDQPIQNTLSQFESVHETQSVRPELTTARVIVSGGRGLKSAEHFKMIESLADCLKGAVGASRAVVDAGWVPNDYQVGQTGKIVAPDLYIAVGISGAIQHLAGMKESKLIIAINSDPDAPIFQASDYYIVGDLFKILPELIAALQKVV